VFKGLLYGCIVLLDAIPRFYSIDATEPEQYLAHLGKKQISLIFDADLKMVSAFVNIIDMN